jgi:transposase
MATINKNNFTDEFKEGVVKYHLEHPGESITELAKKFGVSDSAIHSWKKKFLKGEGTIGSRGSGNHSSDEAKEIARLKKELKDTQDALDVLKKAIWIMGK